VPQGATPRSLVIHLRGPLTRTCKPGDSVTVAGIFLPQPYTGFRAMRAGLLTTTYLEAMSVTQDKRSYKDTAADDSLRAQIEVALSGLTLIYSCARHVEGRLILLIQSSPHKHARLRGSHVAGRHTIRWRTDAASAGISNLSMCTPYILHCYKGYSQGSTHEGLVLMGLL